MVLSVGASQPLSGQCLAIPNVGNVINWTDTTGNWGTASNWSLNCVPNNGTPTGATYGVSINGTGSDTITLDISPTIDALALGAGETLIEAAFRTLTVGGGLTNNGQISLSGNSSALDVSGSLTMQDVSHSALSLSGSNSSLNVGGDLINGQTKFGINVSASNFSVNVGGNFQSDGESLGGAAFVGSGSVKVGGSMSIAGFGGIGGNVAESVVASGGNLDVTVGGDLTSTKAVFFNFAAVNAGILNASVAGNLILGGNGGGLKLSTDSTSKAILTVAGDASSSFPVSRSFVFGNAILSVGGNFTNDNGSSLSLADSASVVVHGNFINGPPYGSAFFEGLSMNGVNDSATIMKDLNNIGMVILTGAPDTLTVNDLLINQTGGLFMMNGTGTTVSVGIEALNTGVVEMFGKNESFTTGAFTNESGGFFLINGTNELLSLGAFSNPGALTLAGMNNVLADAGDFVNGYSFQVGASISDQISVGGNLINDPSTAFATAGAGTSISVAGAVFNSGAIALGGSGETLTVTGNFNNLSGGSLLTSGNAETVQVQDFNNAAGAKVSMVGTTSSILYHGVLTNAGTITIGGTGNVMKADLTNTGAINMTGSNGLLGVTGDFNNNAGGSLTVGGTSNVVTVTGNLMNAPGASLAMNGTGGSVQVGGMFMNGGNFSVGTGNTLSAAGGFKQSGGTLGGIGTIGGNVFLTGGTLQPGLPGMPGVPPMPGMLTINGAYTQGRNGRLVIALGGPGMGQFSTLSVTGPVRLSGKVDFTTVGGFKPTIGNSFTFLFGAPISGTFLSTLMPSCPVGGWCRELYTPTSVTLQVAPIPEPGTMILFGSGLLALGGYARRKRVARR